MASLEELERRIKEKLAASEQRRQAQQEQLRQGMGQLEVRLQRYTALADRLIREVIRPRLERLAGCFDNARVEQASRHGYVCRFKHTPRFPATATLELGISRDAEAWNIEVRHDLKILPVFFPFDSEDHLVLPLDGGNEEKVAAWVEERVVGFVDTYLRLETLEPYQDENLVTDPVCGMRLNKAHAPTQMEYRGVKYYFCVDGCRQKFAAGPERYVPAGPGRVEGGKP
jgi:YHS domain-containing protein